MLKMPTYVRFQILLFVFILGRLSFSQPITVSASQPFEGFAAKSNKKTPIPLECRNCQVFVMENDTLNMKGFGELWTTENMYDFSVDTSIEVSVAAKMSLNSTDSINRLGPEIMIAFASIRDPWSKNSKSDALTFRMGCNPNDALLTMIRTGMYKESLGEWRYILPTDKWQNIKVILTKNSMSAYVEGTKLFDFSLINTPFPQKGYVGLVNFRDQTTKVKSMDIHSLRKKSKSKKKHI